MERGFSEAEGRTGGDGRGTFFQMFRSILWDCFRLSTSKDGGDVLEPLAGQGQPLLGDDGRLMTTADYLDQLRIHPVYGFLFQHRSSSTAGRGLWRGDQSAGDERQRAVPGWIREQWAQPTQLSQGRFRQLPAQGARHRAGSRDH